MRTDSEGNRQVVDRYFINLRDTEREFLVAPFDPSLVDRLAPMEYQENYLQAMFNEAEFEIPLVKFKMPAAKVGDGVFYAYKVRATHALHGEFGPCNDILAVINTLEL